MDSIEAKRLVELGLEHRRAEREEAEKDASLDAYERQQIQFCNTNFTTANGELAEVVRCRDCKFYQTFGHEDKPFCQKFFGLMMKPDDFCSYGKKGDQNDR